MSEGNSGQDNDRTTTENDGQDHGRTATVNDGQNQGRTATDNDGQDQGRTATENGGQNQGRTATDNDRQDRRNRTWQNCTSSINDERRNQNELGNNDRVIQGRNLRRRIGPIGPGNAPSSISLGGTVPCPRPPVVHIGSLAQRLRLSRTVDVWVWPK